MMSPIAAREAKHRFSNPKYAKMAALRPPAWLFGREGPALSKEGLTQLADLAQQLVDLAHLRDRLLRPAPVLVVAIPLALRRTTPRGPCIRQTEWPRTAAHDTVLLSASTWRCIEVRRCSGGVDASFFSPTALWGDRLSITSIGLSVAAVRRAGSIAPRPAFSCTCAGLPVVTTAWSAFHGGGGVLHYDLLLVSASMMVEPLGQHHHRSGGLIGKREIPRSRLEILGRLCPGSQAPPSHDFFTSKAMPIGTIERAVWRSARSTLAGRQCNAEVP
jgi:hypothetical protein